MIRPRTLPGAPGLRCHALLLLALSGCGAASRDAVRACSADPECGPAARCVQGACQTSTPPLADFTLPAALTTHRLHSVVARVTDADAADTVASWAWTVTRLSAGCDADVDVADAAALEAVFWCAGTYQVSLVVTDAAGAVSTPVHRTATVAALEGAPSVSAGPPAAVDHQCAGEPLRCQLAQPVALTASGQAPLGGPLTYRWTALPPSPSRAGATALFSPSPTSGDTSVSLSTAGGPISGAWRLRVRAEDAAGNLAQAVQVMTVGNRAPVVDGGALALDHRYDGAYRVDGALAVPVADPDGDPVEVALSLHEPAGSGCSAALSGVASAGGTLALSCPTPAGLLASGRALLVTATDVNGAEASVEVPVRARNRLPELRPRAGAGVTSLVLPHGVGPCPGASGTCFLVGGENPFTAVDPDGDPVTAVTLVPAVEAGRPASFAEALPGPDGGSFRFGTPVAFPAEFCAADDATGFWLTATASDPFGASGPAQPALAIRATNRAPTKTLTPATVRTGHHFDAGLGDYLATAGLGGFADPDGDPLDLSGSVGDASCFAFSMDAGLVSVACRRHFVVAGSSFPTLAGFAGSHALTARASDGWATASHATTLVVESQPPTVADYDGAIEACACRCAQWDPEVPGTCAVTPRWVADATAATFPGRPADADGDPVNAAFRLWPGSPADATLSTSSVSGLPGSCTTTLSTTTFPVHVEVTVNDGVSSATAIWTARAVTCARAGQMCTAAARR